MCKNLMIYPFGKDTSPIVRNKEMLLYNLTHLVAPHGWGIGGQDSSILDGGTKTNCIIREDFEQCLDECDIIFLPYDARLSCTDYETAIESVVKKGKKAFITAVLKEVLAQYNVVIPFAFSIIEQERSVPERNNDMRLLPINTPVIMVMGDGDYCNKYDIQLSLRKHMISQDYKISQLGSKDYSPLFGFDCLPSFLFDDLNIYTKILLFNHYLYKKVRKEKPEIIILGVPGGIMPINDEATNYFGELAFVMSNAARPDITIRSVYQNLYNKQYFHNDQNICKYKLGSLVDYYNISNTKLIIDQENASSLSYMTVTSDFILDSINDDMRDADYTVCNALNNESMEKTCEQILEQLANNIAVM